MLNIEEGLWDVVTSGRMLAVYLYSPNTTAARSFQTEPRLETQTLVGKNPLMGLETLLLSFTGGLAFT